MNQLTQAQLISIGEPKKPLPQLKIKDNAVLAGPSEQSVLWNHGQSSSKNKPSIYQNNNSLIVQEATVTKVATVDLKLTLSNTSKIKDQSLKKNILMSLEIKLAKSTLVHLKLLVTLQELLVKSYKPNQINNQLTSLLMLQTGHYINLVSFLTVENPSITLSLLLDTLMVNIGSLKILGELLGERKDSLDQLGEILAVFVKMLMLHFEIDFKK